MADINSTTEKGGEQGALLTGLPNQPYVESPVIVMPEEEPGQKDCFMSSVVGYLLCPVFGICAMYYAARTNYSIDLKAERRLIEVNYTWAKICTLMSIISGFIILVIIVFLVVYDPEKLDDPIYLRLMRLYRR